MITSLSNSRIKTLVQLNQKSKLRNEMNVFLVEGIKMFLEAPIERIREVYVSESFYFKCTIKDKIEKQNYEILSDEVFRKVSDTVTPQGILCVIERKKWELNDLMERENPLLLMLEDLQDPGNLGTIIRTGEGAGVDGIILSNESVDLYNPKTIRATMGSIYRIPVVYESDLLHAIAQLKKAQIKVYAAHLEGEEFYDSMDYRTGSCFLIGNEGNGLKEDTAMAADCYMKIPMQGQVESLNAAIAASLFVYEAEKQRRRTL